MEPKLFVAVKAFIIKDNKILILTESQTGFLDFPGGRVEEKEIKLPSIRNGANGTLLFIVILLLLKSNKQMPNKAPSQKENKNAETVRLGPKSHPSPRANLASPNPIHFPLEISHKSAKNEKKDTPDKKF